MPRHPAFPHFNIRNIKSQDIQGPCRSLLGWDMGSSPLIGCLSAGAITLEPSVLSARQSGGTNTTKNSGAPSAVTRLEPFQITNLTLSSNIPLNLEQPDRCHHRSYRGPVPRLPHITRHTDRSEQPAPHQPPGSTRNPLTAYLRSGERGPGRLHQEANKLQPKLRGSSSGWKSRNGGLRTDPTPRTSAGVRRCGEDSRTAESGQ
ncbi:hypothetical protein CRENBAI_012035 [Crenichthys baileyi]|uniref:Uncharacterized protein n=1 Tax=Crenichthys baileyi TaxID=28760 RepID=A0AAV9RAG5_9TELE